jgi:hypothetical protein
MVDPVNDIARQARRGSVSAIIQVLNETLADSGVRTRAMFDQGVLQLLCEATKPEQLEQSVLVPRLRQILEALQPRNLRRVNINSRIVREQQLLWLEEIHRDPTNLLWSEEITLAKRSFLQRVSQDWQSAKPDFSQTSFSKTSPRMQREKKVFWRGLIGGASLSLFLLLLGWALYSWLSPRLSGQSKIAGSSQPSASPAVPAPAVTPAVTPTTANSAVPNPPAPNPASPSPASSPAASSAKANDPFAEAVRLAESTAVAGQSARTSAEWLDVSIRWQKASDLMAQIPATDPRYITAQDRVKLYRQNSQIAIQQAQK